MGLTTEEVHDKNGRISATTGLLVPNTSDNNWHRASFQFRQHWDRLLLDTWFPEAVAMTFSATCMLGIAAVLRVYEGKASTTKPYGITLNAMVSVLATASKSSLFYAVASAVSQLKWCWFTQRRKLQDLQSFDDASRGPWGSMTMLCSLRTKSFASVGAAVIILALAFDPLLQQILHYPARGTNVPSASATIKRASTFTPPYYSSPFDTSIKSGMWSTTEMVDLAPACPSGNCSWPVFPSAGWCSKCINSTSLAELTCDVDRDVRETAKNFSCELGFGHGKNVTVYSRTSSDHGTLVAVAEVIWPIHVIPMLEGMQTWLYSRPPGNFTHWVPDVTYLGIRNPALAIGYASLDVRSIAEDNLIRLSRAEECILTLCLRYYNVSVRNGLLQRKVESTNYGTIERYDMTGRQEYNESCWQAHRRNITYANLAIVSYVNATSYTFCPVDQYPPPILKALKGHAAYETNHVRGSLRHLWKDVPLSFLSNSDILTSSPDNVKVIATNNLSFVVGNIAASLTKLGLDLSSETVTGNVTSPEVYVLVRWQWLALPIILELGGIIVCAAAIRSSKTHKVRLWKASILPLLYHGLEEPNQTVAANVCEMEQVAKHENVVLTACGDEKRIMLRKCIQVTTKPISICSKQRR
jgi:hypothetical protein